MTNNLLHPDQPLSLALGAAGRAVCAYWCSGSVDGAGLASISEIVGSSAGAIIGAFYAAVGFWSLPESPALSA
ncbi:MAG: hypothetical protein U0Y68_25260 [Blastocatellia bacterium]